MKAREPFPILYVRDVARSESFYCEAFGFEAAYRSSAPR
jgi:catechol 2,3-dioxygenase-like lactoylglutathione lyase family enzyme